MSQHSKANTVKTLNNQSQLESTYLLCVEPQTQKLFQVNIGNQEAEEVKLGQGKGIENKIKREEYKIDQLLDRQQHQNEWFFQNEYARNFRSQMVPFYLLEVEASRYPVYVDNSNIEKSLTDDFKINTITIIMSESIKETMVLSVNESKNKLHHFNQG